MGIIAVHDRYDREDCLRAGRIWQRAHLLATARGVAGRPCNESVEMIDHDKALAKPPHSAGLLAEFSVTPRGSQRSFSIWVIRSGPPVQHRGGRLKT